VSSSAQVKKGKYIKMMMMMRDTDGAYRRLCLSKRGGGSSSSSSDGRRLSTQEPVYFLPNWHRRNIFIFLKKKKKIHFSFWASSFDR
jgi:hypothetical protein